VAPRATLAYGEPARLAGLHLVQTDTDHWVENVTGLAACGAHLVVGAAGDGPQQGHPLVPVIQVAGPVAGGGGGTIAAEDVDHVISGDGSKELDALREVILATARRDYQPASRTGGFVDFQLTRGLLGVST
jgi:altronate dehydratase